MFGLIEDKNKASASLKALSDKNTMLSNAGIRSLSKGDQFFLYQSNYWRGAVWINVNYLILRGLYNNYLGLDNIGDQFKTGRDLYQKIRKNLIGAVYKNWNDNHIFWE
jgi:mannosyl-oligosaccharide glucosidase